MQLKNNVVFILFCLSFLIRLIYLFQIQHLPFFNTPVGDSIHYVESAEKILSGDFIGKDVYFQSSPLYPYFLSLIFLLFGKNFFIVYLIQSIIDALNCIVVFYICKELFNPPLSKGEIRGNPSVIIGIISSITLSFYGLLIFFCGELLEIFFVVFFVDLSLLLLIFSIKDKSYKKLLLSGIFLGLSALGKPNTLLIALFIFIAILIGFIYGFSLKRRIFFSLIFTIGVFIPILPITIRNYIVGRDFVLISSNGGINFYIGNNEFAQGTFKLPPSAVKMGLSNDYNFEKSSFIYPERILKRKLKPSEVSNFWLNESFLFIKNNPYKFLKLIAKKIQLFTSPIEYPNHISYYFFKRVSSLLKYGTITFQMIFPLFLLGFIFTTINIKNNIDIESLRKLSAVYIFIFAYTISIILFFITERYRLPVIPLFVIFSSYTIYKIIELITKRNYFILLLSILFVIFVGLSQNSKELGIADAYNKLGVIYFINGDYEKSKEMYLKAIDNDSTYTDAYYNLGLYYEVKNEPLSAQKMFEKSIHFNPNDAESCYHLAFIYHNIYKDNKNAIKYLKRVLDINPYFDRKDEIRQMIDSIANKIN